MPLTACLVLRDGDSRGEKEQEPLGTERQFTEFSFQAKRFALKGEKSHPMTRSESKLVWHLGLFESPMIYLFFVVESLLDMCLAEPNGDGKACERRDFPGAPAPSPLESYRMVNAEFENLRQTIVSHVKV
jgi:hypothetical protein